MVLENHRKARSSKLFQRDRASRCQLKYCQLLHNYTKNSAKFGPPCSYTQTQVGLGPQWLGLNAGNFAS